MRALALPLLLVASVLVGCGSEPSGHDASVATGYDVVRAMQQAHADDWYDGVTFVQTTINFAPDGRSDTTTWYEALKLPGRLRIDIGSPTSGDTWLFRNDSIYVFNDGIMANAVPTMHPLLLLGFDIYHRTYDDAVARLDTLGFDLNEMTTADWQGRPVYVVGASDPTSTAPQFWIDRERLVFVRMLQNVGPKGRIRQDVRFNAYEPLADGWIAPEVLFLADSVMTLKELYNDVRASDSLDDAFFHPTTWDTAQHWARTD